VLVSGVDSATPGAPIIAFVTKDVAWAGEVLIPIGTEVHGRALTDRTRDRILSQNRWVVVWQNGEELVVSGMAMAREYDPTRNSWGSQDCTPGLAGHIITSTSLDEIKLFLATALSGFAMGLQQQTTTTLGIEHIPANARNAALAGTSQVLNTYAQQVLEVIKRDGLYVHVPGGAQFYLYVDEPLDLLKKRIAGSRILPPSQPTTNPLVAAGTNSPVAPPTAFPRLPAPSAPGTPISR
jgi:hypothetical protein